jgi:hypothetical protein
MQSCNDDKRVFTLKNDIGSISIDLNNHFDSFHETVKYSDCGCCCATYWYTFYDSKLDNFPLKDTLHYIVNSDFDSTIRYSLTISHPQCKKCFKDTSTFDESKYKAHYRDRIDMHVQENFNKVFFDSTVVNINDRDYSLLSMRNLWFGKVIERVEAYTIINNEPISIEFERVNADSSNFIDVAKTILNSVKFKK